MFHFPRLSTSAIAATMLLAAGSAAHAGTTGKSLIEMAVPENQELVTTSVNYADLDLGTAHGRHVLERRIAFAARDVCDGWTNVPDRMTAFTEFKRCRTRAVSDAHERMAAILSQREMARR